MRRLRMFVGAVMALGAVAVIGCGGGGDGGQVRMLEEQLAAEEAARLAAEQQAAAEEAAKLAAEQKAAAELAAEEAARLAAEQKAAAEEAARLQAEKDAAEEAKRLEAEKAAAELKAAREEIARLRAEAELAAVQEDDDPADDDADPLLSASASTATPTDDTATTTTDDTHAGLPGGTANPLLGDTTGTTTTTTTPPTTTTQPTGGSQTFQANLWADKLLEKLGSPGSTDPFAGMATLPTAKGAPFALAGYRASSLSATGLRGTRLTGDFIGKETIVAYTDRELTRKVLDHFYTAREGDDAAKPTAKRIALAGLTTELPLTNVIAPTSKVRLSGHGFPSSYSGDTAPAAQTAVTGKTYSGSVYGVSGRFECGEGCSMTLTPAYDSDKRLESVEISSADGLFFTSSGSITLDGDKQRPVDAEYMVFGWWRTQPSTLDGAYTIETFASVPTAVATSTVPTGRYSGTAAGVYVEKGGTVAAPFSKQGEFTASVRLQADGTDVTGEIGGFKATPAAGSVASTTVGRWRVALDTTPEVADKNAIIIGMPGSSASTGSWEQTYVGPRAASGETHASAIAGTFNTKIPNVLYLVGAFGAKRQ